MFLHFYETRRRRNDLAEIFVYILICFRFFFPLLLGARVDDVHCQICIAAFHRSRKLRNYLGILVQNKGISLWEKPGLLHGRSPHQGAPSLWRAPSAAGRRGLLFLAWKRTDKMGSLLLLPYLNFWRIPLGACFERRNEFWITYSSFLRPSLAFYLIPLSPEHLTLKSPHFDGKFLLWAAAWYRPSPVLRDGHPLYPLSNPWCIIGHASWSNPRLPHLPLEGGT